MAKETTVILTDDIDGGKAVETVSFGLDGQLYEIDLGAKNAKNLRKAIAAYIEAGRKVGSSTRTRSASRKPVTAPGAADLSAIRAWAHDNGIQVAARGRVASSVVDQYVAANVS